jgi:hypothetical protein
MEALSMTLSVLLQTLYAAQTIMWSQYVSSFHLAFGLQTNSSIFHSDCVMI